MPQRIFACRVDDLQPGEMIEVVVNRISIGIARDNVKVNDTGSDTFYAFRNQCPHQGAPFHQGRLWEPMRYSGVGEFELDTSSLCVRCPWHGWEFDPSSGKSVDSPDRMKIRAYEVDIADGDLYVIV